MHQPLEFSRCYRALDVNELLTLKQFVQELSPCDYIRVYGPNLAIITFPLVGNEADLTGALLQLPVILAVR